MRQPGKKIGKMTVTLDRMTTRYRRSTIEVELRLDLHSGTFYASYEGARYEAKTKNGLSDLIRVSASKTIDLEWTRYLVVLYKAKVRPTDDSGRPKFYGHDEMDLGDDRQRLGMTVTGIELQWLVCEMSTPYSLPGDKNKSVRMRRDVNESGGLDEPEEQADDSLPVGAVPWTAEREALLREMLVMLGRLDARAVELFRGDPDQLARKLDTARLLSAPVDDVSTPSPSGQCERERAADRMTRP